MKGVAWVTGAGSGLGRAMAQRLDRAGLAVALTGRRRALLEATAEGLQDALVLPGDVREPDEVSAAADAIAERWGRLDVVVHCAALLADPAEQSVDPWTYFSCVLRTNVLGTALVTETAVPHMKRGGLVVLVGSNVALQPTPEHLAYGASKAAVHHLVDSLTVRHARRGLRFVALAPGELHVDGGPGPSPVEQCTEAVVWLLSPYGRGVSGTTLVLDGGSAARNRGGRGPG